MARVFDVASYVIERQGPLSAMKLQKLAYYAQAWFLVWDDMSLFEERIEAWANGPMVCELYAAHQGEFFVNHTLLGEKGASVNLTNNQRETIDVVLDFYGHRSAQWLSIQMHAEAPWRDPRRGLSDRERGNREITLAAMSEYYSSLT